MGHSVGLRVPLLPLATVAMAGQPPLVYPMAPQAEQVAYDPGRLVIDPYRGRG